MDVFKCKNCESEFPASMNHCPKCGAAKWYTPSAKKKTISKESNTSEISPQSTLPSEIEEIEEILTSKKIESPESKNIRIIQYIIIGILLLINISVIWTYATKLNNISKIKPYNDVIKLIEMQEFQKALEKTDKIESTEDKNFLYGILYFKLKQYDKSYQFLKQTYEKDQSNASICGMIGYILYLKKDYKNASEYFKKSLDLDPTMETAKINYEATRILILDNQENSIKTTNK